MALIAINVPLEGVRAKLVKLLYPSYKGGLSSSDKTMHKQIFAFCQWTANSCPVLLPSDINFGVRYCWMLLLNWLKLHSDNLTTV